MFFGQEQALAKPNTCALGEASGWCWGFWAPLGDGDFQLPQWHGGRQGTGKGHMAPKQDPKCC